METVCSTAIMLLCYADRREQFITINFFSTFNCLKPPKEMLINYSEAHTPDSLSYLTWFNCVGINLLRNPLWLLSPERSEEWAVIRWCVHSTLIALGKLPCKLCQGPNRKDPKYYWKYVFAILCKLSIISISFYLIQHVYALPMLRQLLWLSPSCVSAIDKQGLFAICQVAFRLWSRSF